MKDPFAIIRSRHITEKATVLEQLQYSERNTCSKRCNAPKYVFIVAKWANKREIAQAVEMLYKAQDVKVTQVNTLHTPRKKKRKGRGKVGTTASYKKAIVTLESGDVLEDA